MQNTTQTPDRAAARRTRLRTSSALSLWMVGMLGACAAPPPAPQERKPASDPIATFHPEDLNLRVRRRPAGRYDLAQPAQLNVIEPAGGRRSQATIDADRAKAIELFKECEGIAEIITPDGFAQYGLPQPRDYSQMADLILVAKDGYGFSGTATGDDVVVKSETTVGTHGFLSTHPKMNATFIASGAGIPTGKTIEKVENIDLSPTIAYLLGLEFDEVQGRVVKEALETPAANR